MIAYNEAKELMDNMLKRINAIISISAEGGDPEIADFNRGSLRCFLLQLCRLPLIIYRIP